MVESIFDKPNVKKKVLPCKDQGTLSICGWIHHGKVTTVLFVSRADITSTSYMEIRILCACQALQIIGQMQRNHLLYEDAKLHAKPTLLYMNALTGREQR